MALATRGEWPLYYTDDVPPSDAADACGHAFRLVSQIPPVRGDFASTYEVDMAAGRARDGDWGEICGTSMYTALDEIQRTRARYRPLRKMRIAEGVLVPSYGKMKKTRGPCHITVWLRLAACPENTISRDAETSGGS